MLQYTLFRATIGIEGRDFPRCGDRARASLARYRCSVHQPDIDLSGAELPEQNAGSAASVVVANAHYAPTIAHTGAADRARRRTRAARAPLARDREPVHEPDVDLSGAAVLPQNVTRAVPIEIANPQNRPVGRKTVGNHALARNPGPVHEPDVNFPTGVVLPEDIGFAIVIEIANAHNVPTGRRRHRSRASLARDGQPVHQPDVDFAGGTVLPQNIGFAIAIEIADGLKLQSVVTVPGLPWLVTELRS